MRLEKSIKVTSQLAKSEIRDLLDVLSDFLFGCGLDAVELAALLREVSIRREVKKQSREGERISISRVSAVTGISRGEISRLLKSGDKQSNAVFRESPLNRVLRAWQSDAKFLFRRHPMPLKLFGRGASFESLVKIYGRGLPTRAVLDELISVKAIGLLSSQMVVFKRPVVAVEHVTREDIKELRAKVMELLGSGPIDLSFLEKRMGCRPRRRNFKRVG